LKSHVTESKATPSTSSGNQTKKEVADVAPEDVIYILPLFAYNKNGANEEVCRYSSALVLKRNTGSDDTYQRIGFQLWVERMVFQDALETEVTII
jgi:hypothetical protein